MMDNSVKQDIVEWILKPENEDLLETLRLMKEQSVSDDWIDDLTESEKNLLKRVLTITKRETLFRVRSFGQNMPDTNLSFTKFDKDITRVHSILTHRQDN